MKSEFHVHSPAFWKFYGCDLIFAVISRTAKKMKPIATQSRSPRKRNNFALPGFFSKWFQKLGQCCTFT